jgi:peptidoglycan/LPS O-acetylase OafA/YrhL
MFGSAKHAWRRLFRRSPSPLSPPVTEGPAACGTKGDLVGEIRCFTGLRGFAAVLVMLYHFKPGAPDDGLFERLIDNGYLWVDLFFVLSGFVMAYTYERLIVHGEWPANHISFLIKRVARIYPLYLLVTIESAGLHLWRASQPGFDSFPFSVLANLAMVQAWGVSPSFAGDLWSISTEWAAYLIFPLLLAITLTAPPWRATVVGVIALAAIAAMASATGPDAFTFDYQGRKGPMDIYSSATSAPLFRCLAEFSIGLLCLRVARVWSRNGFFGAGPISTVAFVALAGFLMLPGYDLAVVILLPVLLTSLSAQRGIVAWMLALPLPYVLGEWSYSIYLVHDKFTRLVVVARSFLADYTGYGSEIAIVLTSLLVIAFASRTYAWIERPCRRLLRFELRGKPPASLMAGN